jgi:hypothetical protein
MKRSMTCAILAPSSAPRGMTQGQPGPRRHEDRDLFRQLVRAALDD